MKTTTKFKSLIVLLALLISSSVAPASAEVKLPAQDCQIASSGSEWNTVGFPLTSRFSGTQQIPTLPLTGKIKILYVPVDFSNYPDTSSPVGYGQSITKLVAEFYHSMSYNKVTLDFKILPSYVRMPSPAESYGLSGRGQGDYFGFFSQALQEAAKTHDISGFDAVVVLGSPRVPLSAFTPGPAFLRQVITEDGAVRLGAATGSVSSPENGFRWMAHEIGHLFGWADLYNVTGPDTVFSDRHVAFGYWDIMSMNWLTFSLQINGWFRFQAGWIEDDGIVCLSGLKDGTYEIPLSPLHKKGGTRIVAIKISDQEVLVIENRKRGSYSPMPGGSNGLLVYLVNGRHSSSKAPITIVRKDSLMTDHALSRATLKQGESVNVTNLSITNLKAFKKTILLKVEVK